MYRRAAPLVGVGTHLTSILLWTKYWGLDKLDFNEKDKSMKENLSMSDALILIYHELKRFNDRIER